MAVYLGTQQVDLKGGTPIVNAGIDTSDATATAEDIVEKKTAYVNGEKVTGSLRNPWFVVCSDITDAQVTEDDNNEKYVYFTGKDPTETNNFYLRPDQDMLFQMYETDEYTSVFGNATASDVVAGKTFTSKNNLAVTGTHVCPSPTLQSKSVTPSESSQSIKPDSGYDGLSQVSVGAISNTYVGSGVTKKAATTYTPTTSNQTIASGTYLSGTQTIKGDSNLVSGNIKSGVSIFGVSGSCAGQVMKSGTTTSATINTGLSSISAIVIYKGSLAATGFIQGVYITSEDKIYYTYCSYYNTYSKTCAATTSTASSVSGGTFTLGLSGTSGLSSSTTYNWIAFGNG